MGYTWLGMRKLTWEEVLQRHEKGELAGCFRLYDDNSEAMIDRGYDFAGASWHTTRKAVSSEKILTQ